jgi:hypothetical protein
MPAMTDTAPQPPANEPEVRAPSAQPEAPKPEQPAPSKPRGARVPPWTTDADPSEVRVPSGAGNSARAKWSVSDLDRVPADGGWHGLAEYGATTGYQVARQGNAMGLLPPGEFEFGVRALPGTEDRTELVVRRLKPAAPAAPAPDAQ